MASLSQPRMATETPLRKTRDQPSLSATMPDRLVYIAENHDQGPTVPFNSIKPDPISNSIALYHPKEY